MRTVQTQILLRLMLAAFLSAALLPRVLDAQTQKIRIAYSSRSNTITPLYVAASKGFFREEGLEVELIQVSPRLGAMAVMNGDVSFTTSFVSTFRGILQGLPLKVILIALKKGMYFLVVRPEIKDVQELLDVDPPLAPEVLEITRWVADYYAAPWGEVMRAALPAETYVWINAVKALAYEGVPASTRAVRDRTYLLSRPLILVTRSTPTGLQKQLIDYAASGAVTDLHEKHGFVPYEE